MTSSSSSSSSSSKTPISHQSRLFVPYRSLGHVCDAFTPFHVKRLGRERFVTLSLGQSWQTLNCDRLRVTMLSSSLSTPSSSPSVGLHLRIRAVTSFRHFTFVAFQRDLIVYQRHSIVRRYRCPSSLTITHILLVAHSHIVSVDEWGHLVVWDIEAMKLTRGTNRHRHRLSSRNQVVYDEKHATLCSETVDATQIEMGDGTWHREIRPTEGALVAALLHPPTFVNKIVIIFTSGTLMLFNICTMKGVHVYRPLERALVASVAFAAAPDALSSLDVTQFDSAYTRISCVALAPVAGVLGIGYTNGAILLFDLDHNCVISSFAQAKHGTVTAMAFRDDGVPHLITGTKTGDLLTWDLGKKDTLTGQWVKMPIFHHCLRHAHQGSIISLAFLPQEPLLLSSSTDNALHMFTVDNERKVPQWLKSRAGHASTPTLIRFYPRDEEVGGGSSKSSDHLLLSAGADCTLRMFSMRRDEESRELGQNKWHKQFERGFNEDTDDLGKEIGSARVSTLGPITSLAFTAQRRERHFANVLTSHTSDAAAHAWSTDKSSIANLSFINPKRILSVVKSTTVSACGHWAIIGKADGAIEMYSMESAHFKGSFTTRVPETAVQAKALRRKGELWSLTDLLQAEKMDDWKKGNKSNAKKDIYPSTDELSTDLLTDHTAAVTGLATDALNRWCLSVSLDGHLKTWDFASHALWHSQDMSAPITRLCYQQENDLFALSLDSGSVLVFDASGVNPHSAPVCIRTLVSHTAPLTDLCFHPRGHLLLTAAMDGSVHVHDLRSAVLVDALVFAQPVVSCAWSPLGDCIATSHAGNVGIQIWINKEWTGEEGCEVFDVSDEAQEISTTTDGGETEEIFHDGMTMDAGIEMDEEEAYQVLQQRSMLDGSASQDLQESALSYSQREKDGLISFSTLPRTKWHALLNMDALRARNKVDDQSFSKNPEAPFFLPSVELTESLNKKRKRESEEKEATMSNYENMRTNQRSARGRIISSHGQEDEHSLIVTLRECQSAAVRCELEEDAPHLFVTDNEVNTFAFWQPALNELIEMSTSQIDSFLLSLSVNPHTETEYLRLFLHFLIATIPSHRYYEFLQSLQLRFLRLHSLTLRHDKTNYSAALEELRRRQQACLLRLEDHLTRNIQAVKHLGRMR